MLKREAFGPMVKTAIFTLLVPFVVGWWLPYRVHWTYTIPTDTGGMSLWPALASYPFLAMGVAIYFWCAWDFAVTGLGTPAPIDAPKVLVATGLYRYVRNPMYVGVAFLIISQAISWRSYPIVVYLIFIVACFYELVIAYEEPHLKRVFGEQYEQYCLRVPRWLPRFRSKDR
jgi:protein-S-isoprenylcysteine O-methyltransferase Ste14